MALPATAAVRLLAGDKEPARLASTANLALSGLLTVDSVVTAVGDRVLAKDQTDATTNGIYIASEGVWHRAPDTSFSRLLVAGMKVAVQEGTVNADSVFNLRTDRPNLGDDDIEYELYLNTSMLDDITDAMEALVAESAAIIALGLSAGKATQAEAEAGVTNVPWMTPLRTKQAIATSAAVGSGRLVWSVASNALTVSLKNGAGNDPSASEPVSVTVRDASATVSTETSLTITSALSLVISSGSTMGFSSTVAGRLWAVLFNDGGTPRIGLINCRATAGIYPLGKWPIVSSTAEGGAGGADSAQVFYTGSAVTAKPYAVLGYAEWSSGLATAGTWNIGPTRVQSYRPGVPLPGEIVQSVSASTTTSTTTTGTSYTATASEVSITPISAANPVTVEYKGSLWQQTQAKQGLVIISKGGTQIGAETQFITSTGGSMVIPISGGATDYPATTSSVTYAVAIKNNTSGSAGLVYPVGSAVGATISATEIMG